MFLNQEEEQIIKNSLKLHKIIYRYLKHYKEYAAGVPIETSEVNEWDRIFFDDIDNYNLQKIFYISARTNLNILADKQVRYLKNRKKETENDGEKNIVINWEEFEKEEWQNAIADSLVIYIYH